MARTNQQSARRKLRRLVLSGDKTAAERYLLQYLREQPDDDFMQEELQRLQNNTKLLVTETAAERRQRLRKEQLAAISRITTSVPVSSFGKLTDPEFRSLSAEVQEISRTLSKINEGGPAELRDYKKALQVEQSKRRRARMHRAAPKTALITAVLLLPVGLGLLAHRKATQWEQVLLTAMEQQRPERVEQAVEILTAPFYRFVAPGTTQSIEGANRWLTNLKTRKERLHSRLQRIENGNGRVSAMPISERAAIERELSSLPPEERAALQKRWQTICSREASILQQQKLEFISKLRRPLPPCPAFTGSPEHDLVACTNHIAELRPRISEFHTAPASFELSQDIIAPVRTRLRETQATADAIRSYRLFLNELKHCRSYAAHLAAVQRCSNAAAYTPAATLQPLVDLLPPENDIKAQLKRAGYTERNAAEEQAMAQTLLKGGPTFTAAYPATAEQLHLVEDLFTAPSLYSRLYRTTTADGQIAYSEQAPRPDYSDNRIYITRSDLDPEQNMNNRELCIEGVDSVQISVIDAGKLMKHLGLTRQSFFQQTNMAALLTRVLNFRHSECPALAQAYVYYTLLSILDCHPHPHMTGVRHCPTMRRHATEFTRLARRHNLPLRKPGAWLSDTPATRQAESEFRDWFTANADADYCAEIRQNFGPLGRVGLQYSGYIDENGQAVIFRELTPGKHIWYMTTSGFKSTPIEITPASPLPFSPIFNAL